MAEKKGFFRRIFSFGSDPEDARVPEHGEAPRPSDTEVGRADAPDPDLRPQAAANTLTDEEAGADVADGGGITPLAEAAKQAPESEDTPAETDEAQKKTSTRSNGS
ncbi:hypothetical protein [Aurantimonas sp. VKM B-3413]|uniref:hypothetical protein n=1 Tax=Aurantimonas sp. VKM B-3413 TaxID=2779401 RepID=UPI001E2D9065|nr:hypothetical protein [Aurantimonas sp. VKM B-3413]MCB8839205.1 hypothetical protein [Aurantimonas sp. VKM B-3413]